MSVYDIITQPPQAFQHWARRLTETRAANLLYDWQWWQRPDQQPPAGDWSIWLLLAGRGFGKTRVGAEWVRAFAERTPQARIALVAANLGEARAIMVEGESGLLSIAPPATRPVFESSLRRLTWPNGATATLYGASEPEMLRGPEHHIAWCDEIGKWLQGEAAWDNLMMTLRLGARPQTVATTTPRAVPLLRRLMKQRGVAISRGSTAANSANLAPGWYRAMQALYGDTRLGRQELDGEMLDDIEGALWSRELLERCRIDSDAIGKPLRIVVAVDPPASARGDSCGIVVAAQLRDGRLAILDDCSLDKPLPKQWAHAVAQAAARWNADRVVAEVNMGGDMVAEMLAAADVTLPVRTVHAHQGKARRAEPIALLYEKGRIVHAGHFARLEDELAGLQISGGYVGTGRSPDRADAAIWALTALSETMRQHQRPIVRKI